MKYFAVIWGMIIFLLACLPCTDSGTAYAQGTDTLVQADTGHSDAEQETDLCSPLCECNCCGGLTLSFQLQKVTQPLVLPQRTNPSTYVVRGPVDPVISFWHPPKV
ncbi:DUF6660 family protein [Pontibacter sp. Tf4]|uniref:DUF6660 family protein n=1 Tax=Pontibacter sp. Tf4 TaxID=2761620 RepID=UPI00351AC228